MTEKELEMFCQNHIEIISTVNCVVCGKPVCQDCAITRDGVSFCNDGDHSTIHTDCLLLGTAESMFEAELVTKNLTVQGIKTYWFGHPIHGKNSYFKIFVQKQKQHDAHTLLHTLDLIDFIQVENHGK